MGSSEKNGGLFMEGMKPGREGQDEVRDALSDMLRSITLIRAGIVGGNIVVDAETGEVTTHIDASNVDEYYTGLKEDFGEAYPELFSESNDDTEQ